MLKLCSPVFPLRNMLRISASSFHTGLSQQPPSALLQSTAVPNRSTSYRQQTLCLYSPFYDYPWPAAAMTLQLALEDVEALYLGWCCDDKCSQNTTSDITEYRASSLWIKVESVANQFTWHLNWKIFVKYFVHKNVILNVDVFVTGPSFLMADPMGPLLDQDEEEALSPSSSLEGKAPASPPLSFSSYASSLSPYQTLSSSPHSSASPPPSPPPTSSFLGTKARADSLSLTWLGASDLLDTQVGADDGKGERELRFPWFVKQDFSIEVCIKLHENG